MSFMSTLDRAFMRIRQDVMTKLDRAFMIIRQDVMTTQPKFTRTPLDTPYRAEEIAHYNFLAKPVPTPLPPIAPITRKAYRFDECSESLSYTFADDWFSMPQTITVTIKDSFADMGDYWLNILSGSIEVSWYNEVMEKQKAYAYARSLDQLHYPYHRDVTDNHIWQRMYCVDENHGITFKRLSPNGNMDEEQIEGLALPCHNCGFYWPLKFIQVDHYIPRANHDKHALLKALRLLGLTEAGPSGRGRKALWLHDLAEDGASAVGNLLPICPQNNPPGEFNFRQRESSNDYKRSLTDAGMMFVLLLLIGSPDGTLTEIDDYSKNLLSNLVPLCGPCNNNKKNRVKNPAP